MAQFIGVDVGSESVRAGLFTGNGELLAVAKCPIQIWRAPGGVAEQSSAEIWTAICKTVRHIVNNRNTGKGIKSYDNEICLQF
jgi:D-ribulokinase